MKIQAINGYQNARNYKLSKTKDVSFGSVKLPDNGWKTISGIENYKCLENVWSVPSMVTLGLLHKNNLEIYAKNSKPIIAYSKRDDGSLHCLFGNGSYYPYVWVFFCSQGLDGINKLLKDEDAYTAIVENDNMVDGVKLSHNNCCTICQKSIYYPSDWDDRETSIPARYLEILKKRLEQDK